MDPIRKCEIARENLASSAEIGGNWIRKMGIRLHDNLGYDRKEHVVHVPLKVAEGRSPTEISSWMLQSMKLAFNPGPAWDALHYGA